MRIAVVGSGPAGMTAAYRLQQAGHDVEVLEARDVVGGRTHAAIRSLEGGISPEVFLFSRRLSSGLPGTSAGPDLPPFNLLAWVRKSSPPSCLRLP